MREVVRFVKGRTAMTAKPNEKKQRQTYYDFITEASKSISDRKANVVGRNGEMRAIRRHHLDIEGQSEFMKLSADAGRFISPYKKFFGYWGVTEALSILGSNKYHPIADVLKAMESVLSTEESKNGAGKTAWEVFKGKRPRSRKNGLDWFGRVLQNLTVLQRIGGDDPYGLKLIQLGACIDLKKDEHGSPLAQLRTGVPKDEKITPVNEIKKRTCSRSIESLPSMIIFSDHPVCSKRGRKKAVSTALEVVPDSIAVEKVSGSEAVVV